MTDDTLIEVDDIAKSFGDEEVLRGVSFEVQRGERLAIIGPSGSGKSTLLKIMAGQIEADDGAVRIDGEDLCAMSDRERDRFRKRIGVAFQEGGLQGSETVAENVALPLRYHTDLPESLIQLMVHMKLELVQLRAALSRMPDKLSGGMAKRAGIARALALDPPIMFYDEPTGGLDKVTVAQINRLIVNLNQTLGVTSIIVTHDLESVRDVAQRVLLLDQGEIQAGDAPEPLWDSDDPLVEQFLHGKLEGPLTERHKVSDYHEDLADVVKHAEP